MHPSMHAYVRAFLHRVLKPTLHKCMDLMPVQYMAEISNKSLIDYHVVQDSRMNVLMQMSMIYLIDHEHISSNSKIMNKIHTSKTIAIS